MRGNITGNGFQTFTVDRANEITAVNTTLATYRYDANGKRVRTVGDGSTVYSVYGAEGLLLHKDNATTGARTDYIYAGGQLVAEVGATPTYIHTDQLGSPVTGTDTAGNVAWTERYAPYGDQLLGPPATQDNLAYGAHHSDAVTGLIYMEARYYDPLIGRFYSNDPVGFTETSPVSFNRYAYGNNNPYSFVDSDGRSTTATGATVGCAASGPACPAGAVLGAVIGTAIGLGIWKGIEIAMNESSDVDGSPVSDEDAPGVLVGEQDDKSGRSGDRHNSGGLAPEHGGTADPRRDFDQLTGGKASLAPEGKGYPEGTLIGQNGITLRPETGTSGPRIDIPARGDKVHETLHYPKRDLE